MDRFSRSVHVFILEVILFPIVMNYDFKDSDTSFNNFLLADQSCDANLRFLQETVENPHPRVIIRCLESPKVRHVASQSTAHDMEDLRQRDREGPRQAWRYGPHRFTHVFYSIDSPQFLTYWKKLYGLLTLTSHQIKFYEWALQKYTKYPHYDLQTLIGDYWQSQWNQDIFQPQSPSVLAFLVTQLQEHLGQLPTLFRPQLPPENIQQFPVLFYSPLSGWGGSHCPPSSTSVFTLLFELTRSFNAYDRLFCDAFNHLNVTFQVNYNFGEFRWTRSFLLRDDLVSAFLPNPGALFYASPGITFVVLKEHPILWNNVLRPFSPIVWGATIVSFSGCLLLHDLLIYKTKTATCAVDLKTLSMTPLRLITITRSFAQLIVTMAYAGMVLVGLLLPVYSWSPRTFAELNKTRRFYGATSFSTAIDPQRLISTGVLNGVSLWKDREIERENKLTPGMYLDDDEHDEDHRYALLMDDDKKSLYIYARSELNRTAKYIHRLESSKESVLQEMRYVSVAPSATKLHGVVETMRKSFESGSWLRWKYLEDNYYKLVAPYLVYKQLGVYTGTAEEGLRSLMLADVSTTFVFLGFALTLSSFCCIAEIIASCIKKKKLLASGAVRVF